MTDIISLLEDDHRKVREHLEEIKSSGDSAEVTRREVLAKVTKDLQLHTSFEEEILYPAAREATGMEEEVKDDLHEHQEAEKLLDELSQTSKTTKQFMETIEELDKALNHHIEDEEEKLFPAMRKTVEADDPKHMAETYEARKQSVASS